MKNIKKVMAMFMIVAVLFGGVVFGATELDTSQEFKLNATINGVLELRVLDEKPTNNSSLGDHVGSYDFEDLTDETGDKVMPVKYLAVRTNQKTAQKITFTVGNLIGTSYATNVMKYTMNFGMPKNMVVPSNPIASGTGEPNQININTINGLTVHYVPFDFTITEAQYEAANADTYSATITFNISAL